MTAILALMNVSCPHIKATDTSISTRFPTTAILGCRHTWDQYGTQAPSDGGSSPDTLPTALVALGEPQCYCAHDTAASNGLLFSIVPHGICQPSLSNVPPAAKTWHAQETFLSASLATHKVEPGQCRRVHRPGQVKPQLGSRAASGAGSSAGHMRPQPPFPGSPSWWWRYRPSQEPS